ncbi:putative bifunctional diguanylate cyclase/phosphodiesterase [Sulfurimonas sp.]
MTNNLSLKIGIILITILTYTIIFLYINNDKNIRIDNIQNQQIENLKTHYKLAKKYFKLTSDTTLNMIQNDEFLVTLLTNYLDASSNERIKIRQQLYDKLEKHYHMIQQRGVLQFHFIMPNNVTSLRMHKPTKFDDNLSDLKYSFRYVNKIQEPISGLEQGKTAPSFRNVNPLFSLNGRYIGAVDVAFAPEILQQNIYHTNNVYSHFILKKELFKLRSWNRNDNKNDYRQSIENSNYFEYSNQKNDNDFELKPLIKHLKKTIASKMLENKSFALNKYDGENYKIIAFLPIKSIEGEHIAYLISYTDSIQLNHMYLDFYILNIFILIGLIILASFIYSNILSNRELKYEKMKFYNLSQYDSLTKLPNRSLFYTRIDQSISIAHRQNKKFAVLFIDVDNFKEINDTYGHSQGDKLLYEVGAKISTLIREEDTLARIGGDEFVIILEEVNLVSNISKVTDKITNIFKKPITLKDQEHFTAVSIGVSVYPDDATDAENLIKYADIAMYKAKEHGKNNTQFYSSKMTEEVVERVELEKDLREAINNEEFIINYQPQIDATNDEITGMEALVRWQHPTKDVISPIKFIPLAEETGLIVELDRLVMKIAMSQLSKWYKQGLNPGVLSMNLAIKQLQKKDFIQVLTNLMEDTDCKPEWLELEITEGQIMTNPEEAIKVLNQISDIGIRLAVDDFGTGYSSLSYLKKLPINKLKIDRSFVKDLPDDEEDAEIAKTVITLAKSLNLSIIAEGVETKEQKDFIVQNGCKNIQGYFYAKPMSADEMEILLKS